MHSLKQCKWHVMNNEFVASSLISHCDIHRKVTDYGLWLTILMDIDAIISLATVSLIVLLGQIRTFYAMANDGLLPSIFAKIDSRTQTPLVSSIINGKRCYLF
jgi:amino acid transporter